MRYYHVSLPIKFFLACLTLLSAVYAQQNNPEIRLAENLLRSQNYESALIIFQKHYKAGSKSVNVINGINRCLEELNLNEERLSFLNDVTVKLPSAFNYNVDLGVAYFMNNQLSKAMDTWQQVLNHQPPEIMRYRLVGQAMIRVRLLEEAIDVYKRAMIKIKGQETLNLEIANLYRIQLDYEKATDHYLHYFLSYKNQGNYVRSMLINMAADKETTDKIIKRIEISPAKTNPDIREILANLYMRNKDYAHALKIILSIEENAAKKQFNYLNNFALEAEKDKEYSYAILAYDNLIKLSSGQESAEAEYKLANAHFGLGLELNKSNEKVKSETNVNQALLILNKIMENNLSAKFKAAELSGDIYKEYYNDLDKALEKYNQAALPGTNAVSYDRLRLKIAEIHILKNDLQNAVNQFKNVRSNVYKNFADYNLAEINYFRAQFSNAKKDYQNLIMKVGMKDTLANNAMDRIFEIDLFSQDSLNYAKYARAALLKRQNKFSEAAKNFSGLYHNTNITSFSSALKAVELYNQLDKIIESNIILEELIEKYEDEDQIDYVYFLLAANYQKSGNYGSALTLYQEILIRFPSSFYVEEARNNAREINNLLKENLN
jgi:tetratricopeptide (TPR) repeat protein